MSRRVWALAAVIAVIYLIDLQMPKDVPLLSFYWLPVLLAATFAGPPEVMALTAEALVLGVASGLQLGKFGHPDYSLRLLALTGISWFTLRLTRERQAQQQLAEASSSQLEATLKALPDLLFEVTREGHFLQAQALQPELLLRPTEQLIGQDLSEVLPPAAAQVCLEAIAEAELQGTSLGRQIVLPLPQGEHWFELSVARKQPITGQLPTFVMLSRDVQSRKQTEASLQRRIRFYAILSRCTRAIATTANQDELLQAICEEAIATGDLKMAWVGLVNPETQMVEPVAMAGEGSDYLQGIQISTQGDSPYGRGPTGSSIRLARPYWCQDFRHDPATQPWHERAQRFQWGASASLPLRCDSKVVGALTLYAGLPNAFSEEIQNLLLDMTVDIDLALDRFAREARERSAQEALQRSEHDYRELTETIHDVIWRIDAYTFTYLYVSPAVERLLGYTAPMLIGQQLRTTLHRESHWWIERLEEFRNRDPESLAEDAAQAYRLDELRQVHRNGTTIWSEVTTTLVTNSSSGALEFHCVSRDVTARKQAEDKLEWLAYYDSLTKLHNRTLIEKLLDQVIRTARRESKSVAVLMLGLDRFKSINDSIGYTTGDAILQEAARRLRVQLRGNDLISRIGSDEFLLVFPGANSTEAAQICERLQLVMRQPFQIGQQTISLTSSVGVSLYPDDGSDQQTLVRMADTAMSKAKRDGRNRFHFFTASLEQQVVRMVELANALHGALERRELRVLYQPQLDAQSGSVVGAEALLRWTHAAFGAVAPSEFIPIAETTGEILGIGEWVLQQAIQQLQNWEDQGLQLGHVAVNLSAVQFRQTNLAERVIGLLEDAGLSSERLELELTESVTMDNPEAAIQAMARFSDAGIRLSIDDFGTGYSSLSYLKRLRVNKIKIDASFVHDLVTSKDDRSIVNAIINMAQGLNVRTIAEGVETESQLALLQQLGCDEIQGYFYARPLSADEFLAFARQRPPAPVAPRQPEHR